MATYQFNPNGALDTAAELQFVTTKLQDSLEALINSVRVFADRNSGAAPDNYVLAQQQWNTGQQEMELSLAVGKVKLEEIHNQYVLGDNRGANVFGSLI
ncbi:hypothetical protein CcI49_00925 [Frankia sp. CcI49]|uniref:WXG100 family type VII secretion target n=1 Tax=unclassified Frankia TaxID=2632575 RepID=UPI0006CA419D|nr:MULTISPECIES: WXG100 family type VII secretion target [unclassified Frankia]KPM56536.1 hypothetical protein ACG83_00990 [Frankia sp. R43]ONH62032.1 hypothetical protein CcI49_00925 [Frankia sp. CcI49]